MNQEDYKEELELAINLAKQAGELIKKAWIKKRQITIKSNNADVVTETDGACEKLIISGIKLKYPNHNFIAEESHTTDGEYDFKNDPTWLIDPIDGTTNFVHSSPFTCVCIGYAINRHVKMGVVYNPILDELFYATYGNGAYCNNVKIQSSNIIDLKGALINTEFGYDRTENGTNGMLKRVRNLLNAQVQGIRAMGSCALNMCYVASGRFDAYYEGRDKFKGPKPWDFAAASIIVLEAGGIVCDYLDNVEEIKPHDMTCGRVLVANNITLAKLMLTTLQK